jgi:hypothetical protein
MAYYDSYGWRPYVPVAERRRKAEREMQRLRKKGHPVSPVVLKSRSIATTFWGKAWCDNLERYSDFSNRLPRGRTYVRNGSVLDLQIAPGEVSALVSGTDIYRVAVRVAPVPKARWRSICADCAGAIDSLVELLQGRFSRGVMERICREKTGLFPAPAEIQLSCSCPDWATMCKHVAAVLYGTGSRLDERPELLFKLRKVDEKDLIAKAGQGIPLSKKGPSGDRVLAEDGLSELFGIEVDPRGGKPAPRATRRRSRPAGARGAAKAPSGTEGAATPVKGQVRLSSAASDRKAPGPRDGTSAEAPTQRRRRTER